MNKKLYSKFRKEKKYGNFSAAVMINRVREWIRMNLKRKAFFLFFDIVIRKFTKFFGCELSFMR